MEKRIADYGKLGLGMFVHFGLYSLLKRGEWAQYVDPIEPQEYRRLATRWNPKLDCMKSIVRMAKQAGCGYVTLTTRHHDGFSLYDTRGLSTFDSPHSACGRDLVAEFVEACRMENIKPFFYHTTLDWQNADYKKDFNRYLQHVRDGIEVLCRNYGEIGGFWFDGNVDDPQCDWQEDALYGVIRQYQPQAIIINNTGMEHCGERGNPEIDVLTFERAAPHSCATQYGEKELWTECAEIMGWHWGYAENDIDYKPLRAIIERLAMCRRHRANMLLNVGPRADGSIRAIDRAYFGVIGHWMRLFGQGVRQIEFCAEAENEKDFCLKGENGDLYLFVHDLIMAGDGPGIGRERVRDAKKVKLNGDYHFIKRAVWLDNGEPLMIGAAETSLEVACTQFNYGMNYIVRVAHLLTE